MLVVTRYRVPTSETSGFRDRAHRAMEVLAGQPGWVGGQLGRAVDDPTLWVLASRWTNVGSYRRALSSYEVKLHAVPLLSLAIDEPTAFEVLSSSSAHEETGTYPSAVAADAGDVGLGSAAAPVIPTDLERDEP